MIFKRKEIKNDDNTIGYIESVFKSDNILKTTYFHKDRRLYIAFSRGHTYSYGNISPSFYKEFESAESHGKFFYKRINNNKSHPYRKEFTLYPHEVQGLKEVVKNHKPEEDENN